MKLLGNALVIFGIADLFASWFLRFDILAELGIALPEVIAAFTPAIAIIIGGLIKRKYA